MRIHSRSLWVLRSSCIAMLCISCRASYPPDIVSSLKDTDRVSVLNVGYDQHGTRVTEIGPVYLDKDHNADKLQLLKRASIVHSFRPKRAPDFIFEITSPANSLHEHAYEYYLDRGILGRDSRWVVVPAGFRNWMMTVGKPVHHRFYTDPVTNSTRRVAALSLKGGIRTSKA